MVERRPERGKSCTACNGSPLRQIVLNCGEEPSVVANTVKGGDGNYGYNAATEEYGNMIDMGIPDPTKVTRSALQYALLWLA